MVNLNRQTGTTPEELLGKAPDPMLENREAALAANIAGKSGETAHVIQSTFEASAEDLPPGFADAVRIALIKNRTTLGMSSRLSPDDAPFLIWKWLTPELRQLCRENDAQRDYWIQRGITAFR